jgi:pyrimidine-nucleoside phosphorylase
MACPKAVAGESKVNSQTPRIAAQNSRFLGLIRVLEPDLLAQVRAVDLIRKKRDGGELSRAEVGWLIEQYTAGAVGDDQLAAFCMAVFFQSMSSTELAALVDSMMRSGDVIDLGDVAGVKVDKHSTGGVGDKISICLAPLVAACGVPVPMISGRGLGHTGGTLDKLSAIPGFSVDLSSDQFVAQVKHIGIALIGQTASLVPADKKLYALRDVTSTVESIPLIAASIMSKKLAEGIDALVLDVKTGSGAFMKTVATAKALATTMIGIGERMDREVRALITDMDQVLGRAVGNANETWEAIEVLRGGGPPDVVELTLELGAEMLCLGQVARTLDDARGRIRQAIADGSGFERLARCVEAQGGDPKSIESRRALPLAKHETEIAATSAGVIASFETEAVGRAGMILGAGRAKSSDTIDLAVGFEMLVRKGDRIEAGQPIARAAYNDEARLAAATPVLQSSLVMGDRAEMRPLILERLGGSR